MSKFFLALFGGEKRQRISIPLLAIFISLLVGALVVLWVGKDPLVAYRSLLQGSGLWPKAAYAGGKSMFTDFMSFLDSWTPMLFASLAVAVAFKAGLFNIGVSGQMLAAGFVATILLGYSGLPAVLAKPLVLLVGMTTGALVGGLIGFFKYRFNINEVVSSIMLNYILQYVVSFFINSYYIDPVSRQSRYIDPASALTVSNVQLGSVKTVLPLGIVLALLTVFAVRFLLDRTKMGFELKMVGTNPKASRYAGTNVGKNVILAMLLSGALAGLAGVSYYMGYFTSIQPRVLTSVGFDAIAVALLGNSNPVGIVFASFLISAITKGSTYMSSAVGLEREIASVITGLILLFSACGVYIRYLLAKAQEKHEQKEAEAVSSIDRGREERQ